MYTKLYICLSLCYIQSAWSITDCVSHSELQTILLTSIIKGTYI